MSYVSDTSVHTAKKDGLLDSIAINGALLVSPLLWFGGSSLMEE